EWAEWGDPAADEATYRCQRDYSPAENVPEGEYPEVFAWTSLEGMDVPPACAATSVAQLRDRGAPDPEERPILLRATASTGSAVRPRVQDVAWLPEQLGAATRGGCPPSSPPSPHPRTASPIGPSTGTPWSIRSSGCARRPTPR